MAVILKAILFAVLRHTIYITPDRFNCSNDCRAAVPNDCLFPAQHATASAFSTDLLKTRVRWFFDHESANARSLDNAEDRCGGVDSDSKDKDDQQSWAFSY